MKIQIFSRWDSSKLMIEGDFSSLAMALVEWVKLKTNLRGANLGRANLRDADLRGANLRDADLGDADLRGANLRDADLGRANLGRANLGGADLRDADLGDADLGDANLRGANLGRANLRDADLRGADLGDANLRGANLGRANLRDADLRGADLGDADLRGADLRGADLGGANLGGANLGGAKNAELAIAKTRILPEGQLIGWKKCQKGVIVKLSIPSEAKRSHAFGRKCRAEFADVLEIIGAKEGRSEHNPDFVYRAGERVNPSEWCDDFNQECAGGIHFYITELEAQNHS